MNIDTGNQDAYTPAIVDHVLTNYDGVLQVNGDVGDKNVCDPRPHPRKAEHGMTDRVVEACVERRSAGQTLG